MAGAVYPSDFRPVFALFCTRGMEEFLSNAIEGILRVGIDPGQIVVGCPNNAFGSVNSVTGLHSDQIQIISTQQLSENEAALEKYSSFGSRSFTDISWKKIFFIRELIELHPQVIYADLDISWIRNPLPYLSQVASVYPIAIQTEGVPRFPPAFCCGFASFIKSERAIAFLDALTEFDAAQLRLRRALTDALSPLIEIDAIADVSGEPASKVTTELVEEALDEVAGTVNRIRDETGKTPRQRRRELKRAMRA